MYLKYLRQMVTKVTQQKKRYKKVALFIITFNL